MFYLRTGARSIVQLLHYSLDSSHPNDRLLPPGLIRRRLEGSLAFRGILLVPVSPLRVPMVT